jgi:hypothetical protein
MHRQSTLTSPKDLIQSNKLPDHFFIPNEANQKARLPALPSLRAAGEAIQKSNTLRRK